MLWSEAGDRWLLLDVTVEDRPCDVRIRDGRIIELGQDLRRGEAEAEISGRGGALIPGLADHHVHLRALAAARRSVDLNGAPLEVAVPSPGTGVLRVIGSPVASTRSDLDRLWPERPVRVQHRSGAVWTLNSAALALLRHDVADEEASTGQFWRASARLRGLSPVDDAAALSEVSAELAAHGVTHVTDATADGDPAALQVRQHLLSLAAQGSGPQKLVLADHQLPGLDSLTASIRCAREVDRGVAIHAVTQAALALGVAAIAEVGPHRQDRIEHAAVCDDDTARRLADWGIPVVTQPSIFARHGASYLLESEQAERALLWRYGGLLRLGVRVVASSDAPYGDANPWATIRAAETQLAEAERVTGSTALESMFSRPSDPAGPARSIRPGEPADVCLLAERLPTALRTAVSGVEPTVLATFVSGAIVHLSEHALAGRSQDGD
jgi:predicted amidohydrolase YtcJ